MDANYLKTSPNIMTESNNIRALSQNYYNIKRKHSMLNNIYNELDSLKHNHITSNKKINFLNIIKITSNILKHTLILYNLIIYKI